MSRRRFALCVASAAVILSATVQHAARPAYAALPSLQPCLAPMIRAVDLMQWPIHIPAELAYSVLPTGFPWPIVFLVFLSGTFYALGAGLHALWMWLSGPAGEEGRPVNPSRRAFLNRSAGLAAGAAAAMAGYAVLAEPMEIELTRRIIRLRGLPAPLAGLTAVQLTDLHHSDWVPASFLRRAVAMANEVRPDLILLTGDYATGGTRIYVRPVVEILSALRPRLGTLAVMGNHDWNTDLNLTRGLMDQAGFHLIDNSRRFLGIDGAIRMDPCEGLRIAGVGDVYEDVQNYPAALGGAPSGQPALLLSHNPDVAEDPLLTRSGLRVDLIVAGHTHGGQVRLPLLGTPVVPSRYGQKYASGLIQGPVCPVFVSRGLGLVDLPLRWGVPPEVAVLEFHPASGA